MLGKTVVLGLFLATPPLYFAAAPQGVVAPTPAATSTSGCAEHVAEIARLRAALREVEARVVAAGREAEAAAAMRQELRDCLDLVVAQSAETPRRNCTPSRSRSLMTNYQWLRRRGHDEHAAKLLDRLVAEVGDEPQRMNSAAWSLMTDDETAGQYDEVALALADRMLQHRRRLDHRMLDTVALAKFLNGQVDEAIALQEEALRQNKGSDDYRRRLRTYQAAKAAHPTGRPTAVATAEVEAPAAPRLNDE